MANEMELTEARLKRVKEQSKALVDTAAALKEIADQLRADVDTLAARVGIIEDGNATVASNLIEASDIVEKQQVKQDGRLDVLEN